MTDLATATKSTRALLAWRMASTAVRDLWRRAGTGERMGYVVGVALLASGLFHGVVHIAEGTAWAGAVSWRKPTVFGLSFGLTLLCLSWVTARLGLGRRRTVALIGTLTTVSLLEVGIITVQQWRGVPSHFNRSTPLHTALFITTGMGIIVMAAAIVVVAVCALRRLDASPVTTSAVRAGLALLLVGQATGVAMLSAGMSADTAAAASEAAGAFARAHALSLHAIQVLPAVAWASTWMAGHAVVQRRIVRTAAVAYTLAVTASLSGVG